MSLTVVVLAAGLGSRFGGVKQLASVFPDGRTVIDRSMANAVEAGFDHAVVVVRSDIAATIAEHVDGHWPGALDVEYVEQDREPAAVAAARDHDRTKPLGTAHAILSAADRIDGRFAVVNADDLYARAPLAAIAEVVRDGEGHALVGYQIARTLLTDRPVTRGLCRVNEDGVLTAIDEGTVTVHEGGRLSWAPPGQPSVELDGTEPVSMNLWAFAPTIIDAARAALDEFVGDGRVAGGEELLLPTLVGELLAEEPVRVLPTDERCLGVTYAEDVPLLVDALVPDD